MQAILVLSVICSAGVILGNIKIFGISLGLTFVFFTGIIAGHFGVELNADMLLLAQNFGLILFVYSLGLQVGPGFFSSFKKGGIELNLLAFSVIVVGTLMTLAYHRMFRIPLADMMGLFSGAVTNTPMLGAAQQALLQVQPDNMEGANNMALGCAVGYPFGVIGVILAIIFLKRIFFVKDTEEDAGAASDNTFLTEFHISNPAIFNRSIKEIKALSDRNFVISRVWRDGKVSIPGSDTIIKKDDHLLVISGKSDVDAIKTIFGDKENVDWNKKDIDWNSVDSQLVSRHILITKSSLTGTKLGSLRLRNSYGINITRVNRAGIDLLPSPALRLQMGDKLTIVGEAKAIDNVGKILGNEEKDLNNPNLVAIFIGLAAGVILGALPVKIPGMSVPIKLGIAGGPIIIGILMGAFGTRLHITTYTTKSANLMLRQLGITVYLAGLGLNAGGDFFDTVFRTEGLVWIALSFSLAVIPVMLTGFVASKFFKVDYASNVGMLCGSMANPMALNYANTTVRGDEPSAAYATVYPLSIFIRVISAQLIMLLPG